MENEHMFDKLPGCPPADAIEESDGDGKGGHNRWWLDVAMHALARIRTDGLSRSEIDETTRLVGKVKSRADAALCTLAREAKKTDPELDVGEVIRQRTGMSGRHAKQIVKVAEQLGGLPAVADRLEQGEITYDHARLLADAAQKLGPEAVETDGDLLQLATEEPVDRFSRDIRDRINRRLIEAGMDTLGRQRKMREAKLWTDKETGLGMLLAKLPAEEFARMRQRADRLYLKELRRDSKSSRDPDRIRTPAQRMADVITALLSGSDRGRLSEQNGEPRQVTQLIVTASIGVLDGTDPAGICEIIGAGPVPRRYLESLSPDTLLAGMIFDRAGRVLRLGRNQRLGNAAQRLAVAVRDGGCFQCGAPMHRCDLHHVERWRGGGRTDVDNLVAVCPTHHRWLETQNLRVHHTDGRWRTQPGDG